MDKGRISKQLLNLQCFIKESFNLLPKTSIQIYSTLCLRKIVFSSRRLHVYVSRYFGIGVSRNLLPIGWFTPCTLYWWAAYPEPVKRHFDARQKPRNCHPDSTHRQSGSQQKAGIRNKQPPERDDTMLDGELRHGNEGINSREQLRGLQFMPFVCDVWTL